MSTAPDLTFYSTAATVIPLFFITLVFEMRFLDKSGPPGPIHGIEVSAGMTLLVISAIGEAEAFHALSNGHPSHLTHQYVVIALGTDGLTVFGALASSLLFKWTDREGETRRIARTIWAVLTVGTLAAFVVILVAG